MPVRSEESRQARADGLQVAAPFIEGTKERVYAFVTSTAGGVSAEDVAEAVGCTVHCARSRLTELFQASRISVVGKQINRAGKVRITAYGPRRIP